MTYPFTTAMRLDVENPALLPAGNVLSQIKNPDGQGGAGGAVGGWGWITPTGAMSYGTASGSAPTGILVYTTTGGPASTYTEPAPVTPGTSYVAGWSSRVPSTYPSTYYYKATLSFLDTTGAVVTSSSTAVLAGGTTSSLGPVTVPTGAVQARLTFNLYGTAAGADPTGVLGLGLRDVKMGPTTSVAKLSAAPLYTNVLNSSASITVTREALNVGTLSASIPDVTYDPSLNALLRPGRRVRLVAVSGGVDYAVFTGKVSTASVQYEPLRKDNKRAQISLTAVDAAADLANVSRPNGVGSVSALRDVLEGAGVPWVINNDPGQGPNAATVSRNESASVLDQIAVTRDSVHGFAWVSRDGVLYACDPYAVPSTTWNTYNETDYADDIDISFDADTCINLINIKLLRLNPVTGDTEEVPYGPFRSEQSIADWGPRSADFTVHGLTDSTTVMQTFANEVFAASAVPQVRVNAVTVRVASTADVANGGKALIDLYRKVRITNTNSSIDQTPRVTSITHRITPKNWLVDLGFARDGGVASPTITPPLPAGTTGGQTYSEALRPLGEVTMWMGAKSAVPVGWLVLDGSTFSGTTYPDLAALLGSTTLPNFTDRFPLGAGTKALATTGGSVTHTHTAPGHTHSISSATVDGTTASNTTTGGTATRVTAITGGVHAHGGATGSAGGTATTATDSTPPYVALWFIIRGV